MQPTDEIVTEMRDNRKEIFLKQNNEKGEIDLFSF